MNNLESKLQKDGQRIKQNMQLSTSLQKRINAAIFASQPTPQRVAMGFKWVGWAVAAATVFGLFLVVDRPATSNSKLLPALTADSLENVSAIDDDLSQELVHLESDIESIREEVKNQLDHWL